MVRPKLVMGISASAMLRQQYLESPKRPKTVTAQVITSTYTGLMGKKREKVSEMDTDIEIDGKKNHILRYMFGLISLSKYVLSAVGNVRGLHMLHKLMDSTQPLKCHGQQKLVEFLLVDTDGSFKCFSSPRRMNG